MPPIATNYPGPYQLRLSVLTSSILHKHWLNLDCDPEPQQLDTFDTITPVGRVTSARTLDEVVEDYLDLIKTQFITTATFGSAELWKYDEGTFDANFVSAYNPLVGAGTNGGSALAAGYDNYSFRTQEGGVMNVRLMGTVTTSGVKQLYGSLSAGRQAIVDHILDDGNVFLGRDTSYPIAFIAMAPGIHDGIEKKLFR